VQSGKIHAKFLKDTEAVQGLFSNIIHSLIPCVFTVIIAIAISFYTNALVALFFLIIIPIDVLLVRFFNKRLRKSYHEYRVQSEEMGAKMSTMLEMVPVTKAHGLEKEEITSFKKTIGGLAKAGLKVDKNVANFGAMSWVVHSLMSGICLVACAVFALNKMIGVGDIVLYQSMFSQISGSVSSLVNLIPAFGSGLEALSSVSEIMSVTDVENNLGKTNIAQIDGNIKFDNVSYRYPETEQNVIDGLSLDVKAGECIAVVGASGSGKSTMMNMIIGFLKPVSGSLTVDGKSIEDLNLCEYRHHISVVPQNSILFSGTIRENITYGLPCYKEEDLQRVVEMANLNEFVKDLPNGLETIIGEHGDKLSGGQKQRITIARALIRNPKILILDEATSALDNISEYHVQKAIASSIKGRTTFIVAHRLSTIRDADRIIVLDNGVAVEMGTYVQLMERKGKFYELKQLNELNLKKAEQELA
jgi:ATP-binding cassette subfamily B protein